MISDEVIERRPFALPGSSLQYGPDRPVKVEHIDLHLTPDLERRHLDATCTLTVRALDEPVTSLRLDAVDLAIEKIECNSAALEFVSEPARLEVRFATPIAPGEQKTFAVTYSVTNPRHGLFFIEPTAAYPHKVRHVYTQCQDSNARYWFPCFDYPDSKQTTSATIVVPKGLFALSNGELVERRDENDRTIFRYRQQIPHSTYLVTFVAGPFTEVQQRAVNVPVFYYVLPGLQAEGERSFGKTPRMLEVFNERLGYPYPYARYSQIAVSDFIFGGMENTAATTQTDRTLHDERAHLDFSSDPLVAHELAHQWFGDLLTCRDWSHAWLNESFATFFEGVFREADLGYDEYAYDVFEWIKRYLEEDRTRYRRPIVCNDYQYPIELFDRHLYEKGGAVLHMLRGELGEARFWRAIQQYVRDNACRSVETIDLIRAIEAATGRNLRAFFDQWIFGPGHPQLSVAADFDRERRLLTLAIEQKQEATGSGARFRFDVTLEIDGRPLRVHVENQKEIVAIPLEKEPQLVRFDPGAFLLADVSYGLSAPFARAALQRDASIIGRIRAGRQLIKDGSVAAREAIESAFENEQFWGVLAELADALGKTHAPWARDLLVRAIDHAHPKVRRAAAAALGEFKDGVADALIRAAKDDRSYFVQHNALNALGKTRDKRAFAVLERASRGSSWNGTVESGAALGLGELADARALPLLLALSQAGNDEAVRRAATAGLGRLGELVDSEKTPVVEAIATLLDDPFFHVQRAAIMAAEKLGDKRLLEALDRLTQTAFDGRLRRGATEAAARIRDAQKLPSQVTELRSELDSLREEHRQLQEKIETLSRS
ncbi:MAG TPA: M1 family aminopeptidase [Candidatus Rubrimentiphilum sp.]|nr:M1 family aminopeptidase [Candidatus Rubrimentiphilum sp.]